MRGRNAEGFRNIKLFGWTRLSSLHDYLRAYLLTLPHLSLPLSLLSSAYVLGVCQFIRKGEICYVKQKIFLGEGIVACSFLMRNRSLSQDRDDNGGRLSF